MTENNRYEIETIKIRLAVRENIMPKASDPSAVVEILKSIYADLDADQEHFVLLTLDKANVVTGFKVVHSGGHDQSLVDQRVVLRNCLLLGATSFIVSHNHPSGRIKPSQEDMSMTRNLQKAGEVLGLKLLDHIIIGAESFCSFQQSNLL